MERPFTSKTSLTLSGWCPIRTLSRFGLFSAMDLDSKPWLAQGRSTTIRGGSAKVSQEYSGILPLPFTVRTVSRSVVFAFTDTTRVRTPPSADVPEDAAPRQIPGHEKAATRSQAHRKRLICAIRPLSANIMPMEKEREIGKRTGIRKECGYPAGDRRKRISASNRNGPRLPCAGRSLGQGMALKLQAERHDFDISVFGEQIRETGRFRGVIPQRFERGFVFSFFRQGLFS